MLFDEIVIEAGLRVVDLSSFGVASVINRGPDQISQELLSDSRQLPAKAKSGLALIRSEDKTFQLYLGTNLPRIDGATYVENEITGRLIGEYHSGVLEDLARLGAGWVRVVSIKRLAGAKTEIADCELATLPATCEQSDLVTKIELGADEAREFSESLLHEIADAGDKSESSPLGTDLLAPDGLLASDLAEAIDLGGRLGAIPALSGAFAKVATERGVALGLPGEESLGFVVPNFSTLPWEAIAEFRDHPGATEARERLREFEAVAASKGHAGSAELIKATGQAVTHGLVGAVKDLAPNLPDDLASPLASSAVGLVPIVGQYASLALSMGDVISAIRQHEQFEQSWVAAVIQLRDAAADTLDW